MKIEFELDQEQKHIPANRQVHQVVVVVALLLLEVVKNHPDRVRSIQPETIHIPWIHVKIYGAPKNPKTRGAPLFCHQVETIIIPFRYESVLRVKSKLGTVASLFSFIIQKIGVVRFIILHRF